MINVICTFVLIAGTHRLQREVIQAPGLAMHTDKEIWLVDLTWFMDKYPKYKKYNNLVQTVDSNNCLVLK